MWVAGLLSVCNLHQHFLGFFGCLLFHSTSWGVEAGTLFSVSSCTMKALAARCERIEP